MRGWLLSRMTSGGEMAQSRKLRVGVLGCGGIAQLGHLPALLKARNVELLAACDAAKDVLDAVAARFVVPRKYTDTVQFLADTQIEAVVIPVAHEFHAPLSIAAMRAGKHVLVEKPMAVTVAECEQMVAVADETRRQLQIGCMKRYDPALETAQKFVRERLGRPLLVSGYYCDTRWHGDYVRALAPPPFASAKQVRPESAPKRDRMMNNLLGHGVHAVDLLRFFGGPIVAVTSRGKDEEVGVVSLSILEYASGATGTFTLINPVQMEWFEGLHIHGEKGSVEARINFPYFKRASDVRMFDTTTNTYSTPASNEIDHYERQAVAFAEAILCGREVTPNGRDGLAAQRVLYAIYESQSAGGKRVEVRG